MKELVNKEKLIKSLEQEAIPICSLDGEKLVTNYLGLSLDSILSIVDSCTLSPAELVEILKGDSWVLEELKKHLVILREKHRYSGDCRDNRYFELLEKIADLESQVPVSELASSDEDRRKADLWDKLYEKAHKLIINFPDSFGEQIGERIKEEMDELLAQSKEEPDEQKS